MKDRVEILIKHAIALLQSMLAVEDLKLMAGGIPLDFAMDYLLLLLVDALLVNS